MKTQDLITILAAACLSANTGCTLTPTTNHRSQRSVPWTPPNGDRARSTHALETKGAQRLRDLEPSPPAPPLLPSELDIAQLSPLAQAWAALPRVTNFVITVRNNAPARVAVYEVGDVTNSHVLVCIHGFFGGHCDWRYIAGALGKGYRLWLLDLPGTGASDSPNPHAVGPGGFSPTAMAERVLQALEAQLAARPEVSRLILCGHSYGGMLALRMLSDEGLRTRYEQTLDTVDGLVLFAPADVVVTQATETWNSVLALNGTKVWLGSATGILPRRLQKSLRSSFCDPGLASCELLEQGQFLLQNGGCRRSTQALMRDALPWSVWGKHPDWRARHALEEAYRNIDVPCLIVWGDCDETLCIAMGYKLKDQIPDARLVVLSQTMHMLPLERPRACAALIRDFVTHVNTGGLAEARSVQTLDPEAYGQDLAVSPPDQQSQPTLGL
jgi:pimeloyl-ACP methyl ester carboxylesterase